MGLRGVAELGGEVGARRLRQQLPIDIEMTLSHLHMYHF